MDATVKIMCRLLFARDTLPSALLLSKATSGLSDLEHASRFRHTRGGSGGR